MLSCVLVGHLSLCLHNAWNWIPVGTPGVYHGIKGLMFVMEPRVEILTFLHFFLENIASY